MHKSMISCGTCSLGCLASLFTLADAVRCEWLRPANRARFMASSVVLSEWAQRRQCTAGVVRPKESAPRLLAERGSNRKRDLSAAFAGVVFTLLPDCSLQPSLSPLCHLALCLCLCFCLVFCMDS